jgi:hypothetical protein
MPYKNCYLMLDACRKKILQSVTTAFTKKLKLMHPVTFLADIFQLPEHNIYILLDLHQYR